MMMTQPAKPSADPMSGTRMPEARRSPGKMPDRHAWLLVLVLTGTALADNPAAAGWKLVDEGACEGPIVSLSEGQEPAKENCNPATAGKGALCYTEVCRPHCLYFSHPLEQCPPGADLGKRYICVPD
jgi:hypothetical protein